MYRSASSLWYKVSASPSVLLPLPSQIPIHQGWGGIGSGRFKPQCVTLKCHPGGKADYVWHSELVHIYLLCLVLFAQWPWTTVTVPTIYGGFFCFFLNSSLNIIHCFGYGLSRSSSFDSLYWQVGGRYNILSLKPIFHWKWGPRWVPNANETYTKDMKCTWPTPAFCVGTQRNLYSTGWRRGLASGKTQILALGNAKIYQHVGSSNAKFWRLAMPPTPGILEYRLKNS